MTSSPSFRRTALVLAVCAVCATWSILTPFTQAQEPLSWQPYREPTLDESLASNPQLALPILDAPTEVLTPAMGLVQTAPFGGVSCEPALVCPQPIFAAPMYDAPCLVDVSTGVPTSPAYWQWRLLPEGVVWQSYFAGVHEPRIAGTAFFDQHGTALLDVALGGRAALVRYGTDGPGRPLGLELQIEGAAFPRLNLDENWDLDATDFRFGLPLVYGRESWEAKFSYYHLSSHMGDEFALRNAASNVILDRINFSRDALAAALAVYPLPAWRWYAEAAWAFHYDGGSEPWELQFGVDVAEPGPSDRWGKPFLAVNGHLREEHNFGGNIVFQAGWLWRGNSTRTMRVGFHYFNGKTNQFEFFDRFEEQIGGGVWCEF